MTILALGGVLFPGAAQGRLSRAVLARPADRVGLARPAAAAVAAADPLRASSRRFRSRTSSSAASCPGILLTAMIAAWGVREGHRVGRRRGSRSAAAKRARRCGRRSGSSRCRSSCSSSMFSGLATAVEAAALTALLRARRSRRSSTAICRARAICCACSPSARVVIGGVLVILGVAVGLTNYLVGAQVPAKLRRVGARAHRVAARVPARAQRVPARRRLADGDLRRDRRRRAADRAARRGVRHPPGAPRASSSSRTSSSGS